MTPFSRRHERLRDLARDGEHLVERHRSSDPSAGILSRDLFGERVALDQLEDDPGQAIRFLEAIHSGDVRMVERGEQFRFALESGQPIEILCECLREDFDRNVALEVCVARPIHLAHGAGAQCGHDLIAAESGAGA